MGLIFIAEGELGGRLKIRRRDLEKSEDFNFGSVECLAHSEKIESSSSPSIQIKNDNLVIQFLRLILTSLKLLDHEFCLALKVSTRGFMMQSSPSGKESYLNLTAAKLDSRLSRSYHLILIDSNFISAKEACSRFL